MTGETSGNAAPPKDETTAQDATAVQDVAECTTQDFATVQDVAVVNISI